MPEGVFTIQGQQPGKTVTILGGVHGDEICGVQALDAIIPNLKIARGTVYCIYGNPRAIAINKRDTGTNLNRMFKADSSLSEKEKASYERARALEIMPYLKESVANLDIHSSATRKSIPFIICESQSFSIAEKLPFSICSYGWDVIEPGGTDYFINKQGGHGVCIECGYNLDPEAPKRAEQSIKIFLSVMGLTDEPIPVPTQNQKTLHAYFIYHTKHNFKPARTFADFEELKAGEVIGIDGSEKIFAPAEKNVIIFCRKRDRSNKEAFVLANTK